jgi:hypothetical protein
MPDAGQDATPDAPVSGSDAGCNGAVANTGGCNAAGWCWQNPDPYGSGLNAISATSPTDVWAAGGLYLFHNDGVRWSKSFGGNPNQYYYSVWALSQTSAWAGGNGDYLLRWNGTQWTPFSPTGLPKPPGNQVDMSVLWGTSDSDMWVGSNVGLAHWTGLGWTHHLVGSVKEIHAIAGTAANDVWATALLQGNLPAILHYDGTSWGIVADGSDALNIQTVWGVSARTANDVWFGGNSTWHWDGSTLVEVANPLPYATSGAPITAIWSRAANDVWAFAMYSSVPFLGSPDASPTAIHWNGSSWSVVPMPGHREVQGFMAVVGVSASEAWGVGQWGTWNHFDGTAWEQLLPLSVEDTTHPFGSITAISGSGADNIWAVGSRAARFDGQTWEATPFPGREKPTDELKGMPPLNSVWTASPTHAWAVGWPDVLHRWTGSQWVAEPIGNMAYDLRDLSGTSATDVWAVGRSNQCSLFTECGKILHYDGVSWSSSFIGAPSETISAVSALAPNEVWAAASGPLPRVLRWNGATWSVVGTLPPIGEMRDIWVRAANDVWIVGVDDGTGLGRVLRYDGTSWSGTPMPNALHGVHGTSANDVWVVGGDEPPLPFNGIWGHWDGSVWSFGELADYEGVGRAGRGVWSSACSGTWVVGKSGLLVHHP